METLRLLREKSQLHADERLLTTMLHRRLESAQILAASMPGLLLQSEHLLLQAEKDLAAGVYGPFWDSVFGALSQLASVVSRGETLIATARFYERESVRLKVPPVAFTLGPISLPDAPALVVRLQGIIRRAHERHEFSVLYEMRRNDVLSAQGFGSFAESLQELPERLSACLKALPPPGPRMRLPADSAEGLDPGLEAERMRYLMEHEHKLMA